MLRSIGLLSIALLLPGSAWAAGEYYQDNNSGKTAAPAVLLCPDGAGSANVCSASNPLVTTTAPAALTVNALDVSVVTAGGNAVTALATGKSAKGGFLVTDNAAGICVNVRGTAGTTTTGDTACVAAGQTYHLPETGGSVSVNSSGSSVSFAGYGFQ